MSSVDGKVQAAFHEHCRPVEGTNRYTFGPDQYSHSYGEALDIVKICVLLNVPVTDVLSGTTLLTLVERVIALEQKLSGQFYERGRE